jgi:hypothetical protein
MGQKGENRKFSEDVFWRLSLEDREDEGLILKRILGR